MLNYSQMPLLQLAVEKIGNFFLQKILFRAIAHTVVTLILATATTSYLTVDE